MVQLKVEILCFFVAINMDFGLCASLFPSFSVCVSLSLFLCVCLCQWICVAKTLFVKYECACIALFVLTLDFEGIVQTRTNFRRNFICSKKTRTEDLRELNNRKLSKSIIVTNAKEQKKNTPILKQHSSRWSVKVLSDLLIRNKHLLNTLHWIVFISHTNTNEIKFTMNKLCHCFAFQFI